MEIFEFEIPGHTTRREWAVYVIVATDIQTGNRFCYVGKVGDNRDGCNPIISRIGNHLSHTKMVSQFRNKVQDTTNFNYKIVYAVFGEYVRENHGVERPRINEAERRLNLLLQAKIKDRNLGNAQLKNPYGGKYVTAELRKSRSTMLEDLDIQKVETLAEYALSILV